MAGTALKERAMWVGSAFAATLLVDVATKWLVVNVVMTQPHDIEITSFFNLTLGFNSGVSFGMFQNFFRDRPFLLVGITLAIVGGLVVWAMRTDKKLDGIALGLIAGGAAGNVLDRVRQGAVTDFLDFHLGNWHWPAFNMADVAISIGVALLVIGSLLPFRSSLRIREPSGKAER